MMILLHIVSSHQFDCGATRTLAVIASKVLMPIWHYAAPSCECTGDLRVSNDSESSRPHYAITLLHEPVVDRSRIAEVADDEVLELRSPRLAVGPVVDAEGLEADITTSI